MSEGRHQKVSIGFAGGQVLAVRVSKDALEQLNGALASERGWHELACEDGVVALDLGQVAYVRVDADELRVGFGA
jgi:hypothetical protein